MLLVINYYLVVSLLVEIHFQCIFSGSEIVVIHSLVCAMNGTILISRHKKRIWKQAIKTYCVCILLLYISFWSMKKGQYHIKKDSTIVFLLTIACQQEQKYVTLNAKCAWRGEHAKPIHQVASCDWWSLVGFYSLLVNDRKIVIICQSLEFSLFLLLDQLTWRYNQQHHWGVEIQKRGHCWISLFDEVSQPFMSKVNR